MTALSVIESNSRARRHTMSTVALTREMVAEWLVPPWQRPIKMSPKVQNVAKQIMADGCISGIITLGMLTFTDGVYVVDGQHRLEAFKLADMTSALCDVRVVTFDTMAQMSEEFVELNSALVKMQPDDILRGLEPTSSILQRLRENCPFVGYDSVRRNPNSPVVSMSLVIRSWSCSASEIPTTRSAGGTSVAALNMMTEESFSGLLRFLGIAYEAWGQDREYRRLWGGLNMTMTMWLYRRLVLDTSRGVRRAIVLDDSKFRKGLMSMSADARYLDWLVGRVMSERDRSPSYAHIKRIFVKRLQEDGMTGRILLPSPSWASSTAASRA